MAAAVSDAPKSNVEVKAGGRAARPQNMQATRLAVAQPTGQTSYVTSITAEY